MAFNPDEFLGNDVPSETPTQKTGGFNPDAFLADEKPDPATLNIALGEAVKKNPDEIAKHAQLANKIGADIPFVGRNYEELELKDRAQNMSSMVKPDQTPAFARWLQDANNAAMVHDDMPAQANIEKSVKEYGVLEQMYSAFWSGLDKTGADMAAVPSLVYDMAASGVNQKIADAGGEGEDFIQSPDWLRNNPVSNTLNERSEDWLKQAPLAKESITDSLNLLKVWDKAKEMDISGAMDELANGDYRKAGKVLAVQMAQNAPQMATLIYGNIMGSAKKALALAGATTAASANVEAQNAIADGTSDVTPQTAVTGAVVKGGIEVGFESIGTMGVLKTWENAIAKNYGKQVSGEVIKDFLKTTLYAVAAEGNEEALTSVAQDLTDYVTGVNPNALEGIGQRALDAGFVGAAMGGTLGSVGGAASGHKRMQEVNKAQLRKDFYMSFGPTVEAAKLRERLPKAQRDFVESVTKGTGVENIYISPEAFEKFFQGDQNDSGESKSDLNPKILKAAQELGVLDKYNDAKATGADMEIPLADWVDKAVGNPAYEGLAEDIKFNVDDKSLAEIKAEREEVAIAAEEAQAEIDKAVESTLDTSKEVGQNVTQQLMDAGHSQADARAQGKLYESTFQSLSERTGIPAKELFDRYNLGINGGDKSAPDAPSEEMILNQIDDYSEANAKPFFESEDSLQKYSELPDTMDGKRIDPDAARSLYPKYAADKKGAILSQDATGYASSDFAQKLYEDRVKAATPGDIVQIFAGGSGSGKTHIQREYGQAISGSDIIFDTTSANYDILKNRIDLALKKGLFVTLTYVYRPFNQATEGVRTRFDVTGRIVPPGYLAFTHVKSLDNMIKIAEEYKDNPLLNVEAFDNSGDKVKVIPIDKLKKLSYIKSTETEQDAVSRLERYADGKLKNSLEEIRRVKDQYQQGAIREGSGQSASETTGSDPSDGVKGSKRLFQSAKQLSPLGFYSQLEAEIAKMDFAQMPAKDLANRLKNIPGLKKEEIEYLGINEWLAAQEGKISKEEVLNFIKQNGVQVEQVVLGGDFGTDAAGGASWREDGRTDLDDSGVFGDNVQNEIENYDDDTLQDQWPEKYAEALANVEAKYPDVQNYRKTSLIRNEMYDVLETVAEEYVRSDDYYGAEFSYTEVNSGFTLVGNDERGYYNPDYSEWFENTNLEEAKIQLLAMMLEKGDLSGTLAQLVHVSEIGFRDPIGKLPSKTTLTKKIKDLVSSDRSRLEAKSIEENPWIKNQNDTEFKSDLEMYVNIEAEKEINRIYADPSNSRNEVTVYLTHDAFDPNPKVVGNNKKGYKLLVGNNEQSDKEFNLIAKDLDSAKNEALKVLVVEGFANDQEKIEKSSGVDAPSGKSKYKSYSVSGGENYREVLLTLPKDGKKESFESGHFDQKNILAHVRLTDREDESGKKTLFIEEIQSDWHQAGREKGYANSDRKIKIKELESEADRLSEQYNSIRTPLLNKILAKKDQTNLSGEDREMKGILSHPIGTRRLDDGEIKKLPKEAQDILMEYKSVWAHRNELTSQAPDAPFKNTESWAGLAFKRILRMAVDQDYDAVAWTPASVHVGRWGTDNISWVKKPGVDISKYKIVLVDGTYDILDESGKEFIVGYNTEESARKALEEEAKERFLVGSAEQRGGNAGGTNIEELARARGQLLERNGVTVRTKEQLKEAIAETLGRERNDRSLDNLTENVWGQMQTKETGVKQPRKEGMEFFYDNLIPKKVVPPILKKLDKDAKVEVVEFETEGWGSSRSEKLKALSIPLTKEIKDKISTEGFTLFQKERGQIRFGKHSINIDLFKNADMSTFLHETGHFYFKVLGDLAKDEGSPQQIKDDYNTLLQWMNVEDPNKISVDAQEQFARGFEAYLLEGQAPNAELKSIFARFKVWLINVYKGIKSLNVELTDDVRGVMDRLVATDTQIAMANNDLKRSPLFKDARMMGMNEAQALKYEEARTQAQEIASEQLAAKILKNFYKTKNKEYKENRKAVRSQVESEVDSSLLYMAFDRLRNGEQPNGMPLKLDRKMVIEMTNVEFLNRLPRPIIYTKKGEEGLHPDIAASYLGFESGDDMLQQMANAPEKKVLIESLTDRRMKEQYPDLLESTALPQMAMEAVHNDKQAEVLMMELKMLAESDFKGFMKNVVSKTVKRLPTRKIVQEEADKIIASRVITDIKPYLYKRAEIKSAKLAGEALAKGDIDQAFDYKKKELLNFELYNSSVEALEQIKKSKQLYKKLFKKDEDLTKTRDMDLVNAARAILAEFGLGSTEKSAVEYLEPVKAYNPDQHQGLVDLVNMTLQSDATDYEQMTYEDYKYMNDTVKAIWDLARDSKQIEIDGKKEELTAAREALSGRVSEMETAKVKEMYDRALTDAEKNKSLLLGGLAYLRRFEHWIDVMDDGNIKGVFRKYLYQPVSEATDNYLVKKSQFIKRYKKLFDSVDVGENKPIAANELNYKFQNKYEILGAMLHIGNSSNLQKLLVGRGWATLDDTGAMDTSRWQAFMDRMHKENVITKNDYDFIQSVWDMMEELKPDAQKAHKKVFGYYFNEITSNEFETPFGKYKGGYAPAKVDTNIVSSIRNKQLRDQIINGQDAYALPYSGGKGFTKSRIESFNKPLALDMRIFTSHMDQVLRFTYVKPAVMDASKLLLNDQFKAQLDEFDPHIVDNMLLPALNRADKGKIRNVEGLTANGLMRFANKIKTNAAMQLMFVNIPNTLQQITGFSVGALKAPPAKMGSAMLQYMKGSKKMTAEISERSPFMRTRFDSQAFDMMKDMELVIKGDPTTYEKMNDWSLRHMYIAQSYAQNIIDSIVWTASYEDSVEKGLSEKDAVKKADSDIRETQSSFRPMDVSTSESNPWFGIFQMFYSYFNTMYNMNRTEFEKIARSDLGIKKKLQKGVIVYTLGYMIPAFIGDLVVQAMRGNLDPDEDDEMIDDLLSTFFWSQIKFGGAMVPLLGGPAMAGLNRLNDKPFDDRVSASPAITALSTIVGAGVDTGKALFSEEDVNGKNLVKDGLTAIGLMSGLPTGALGRPIGYLMDVSEGEKEPTGPIDFTRGLISGN